jgi:hypothetical protein
LRQSLPMELRLVSNLLSCPVWGAQITSVSHHTRRCSRLLKSAFKLFWYGCLDKTIFPRFLRALRVGVEFFLSWALPRG